MLHAPAVDAIAALLADLPIPWGVCGGWAVDLWLDRATRPHKDVDVALRRADQQVGFTYLHARGWSLAVAELGALTPIAPDAWLDLPKHTVWCRHPDHDPDFLELLLNEAAEDRFVFRRDPAITLPAAQMWRATPSGHAILAPEIVLLYKSNDLARRHNQDDFAAALPTLDAAQRRWLAAALRRTAPGHPWLAALTDGEA